MEAGAARIRSAAAWVGSALVLVAVVGVVYLRPSLPAAPAGVPARRAPAQPGVEAIGSISFADARRGSVSVERVTGGFNGVGDAYVTSDGGATWKPGARLTYLTGRIVFEQAASPSGTDRISADGGRTWRALPSPSPGALLPGPPMFVDPAHGWWLLRGPSDPQFEAALWRTDDGGRTWLRLPTTGIPPDDVLEQARFVDTLRGVLVAGPTGGFTSTLFATSDGGLTWHPALALRSPRPDSPSVGVQLLVRGSALLAWLAAYAGSSATRSSEFATYLLVSGDGGVTWSEPRAGPTLQGYLSGPALDDRGRLLILENRRLWVSADEGLTWTARVVQAPEGLVLLGPLAAGRTLLALATTGRTVATVRFVDTLLRSTDDGAHWEQLRLPGLTNRQTG